MIPQSPFPTYRLLWLAPFLGSSHGACLELIQEISYESALPYTFCDANITCMDCSAQHEQMATPLLLVGDCLNEVCCLHLNPNTSGVSRFIKKLSFEEDFNLSIPISTIQNVLFAPLEGKKIKNAISQCLPWFLRREEPEIPCFAACTKQLVYVYDTKNKELRHAFVFAGPIQEIRWMNSDLLLILTEVNMLTYRCSTRNIETGVSLPLIHHTLPYRSFDCLGPQKKLLALADNEFLLWYNLQTMTYEKVALGAYQKDLLMVRADVTGEYIATSSNDGKVLIWATRGNRPLLQLDWCPTFLGEGQSNHGKVVWSPYGKRLLCVTSYEIRVWDVERALRHVILFPLWMAKNVRAYDLNTFPTDLMKVIYRYVPPAVFVQTWKVNECHMFCSATFFSHDTLCMADNHNCIKKLSLKGCL